MLTYFDIYTVRTNEKTAGVPASWVVILDDLQPGLVKTLLNLIAAVVSDSDMGVVDSDDLSGMGAATLAIDGDADYQNLKSGKRQHQPRAQGIEIDSHNRGGEGEDQKQPLGLAPSHVSVGRYDEYCFIRITVLRIP